MKLNKLARSLALIGLGTQFAGLAMAQDNGQTPPPDQNGTPAKLERVEVTGSSIKRVADQGALPLQVITADQMKLQGISSANDLLNSLSANVANANNSVSSNAPFGTNTDRLTGGSNFANLRGLGPSGTLVLLNGRRLSNQGMSGGAVDLNAIPFEMIDRVEVLKDGASAIYGTDAVGGVINFILKKEYSGLQMSATASNPMHGGGGRGTHIALLGGFGDLDKQGFNVMASVAFDGNKELSPGSRSWANGFQPDLGLVPDSTRGPGFANIISSAGTAFTGGTVNGSSTVYTAVNALALQNNCGAFPYSVSGAPNSTLLSGFGSSYSAANYQYRCVTNYGSQYMLATPQQNVNGVLRGTLVLSPNATGFVEFVGSRLASQSEYTPNQAYSYSPSFPSVSQATNPVLYKDLQAYGVNPAGNGSSSIMNYPVNGPYYASTIALLQSLGVSGLNSTLPIAYGLRLSDWGDRIVGNVSYNNRLTVGVDGTVGDYDYTVALSHGQASGFESMVNGFQDANGLAALMASGIYNPFLMPGQTQSAAALAAIAANQVHGRMFGGDTKEDELNASISGKLATLPAGEMDFALGTDFRREGYGFSGSQTYNCVSSLSSANLALTNAVFNCPGQSSAPDSNLNIFAVYGELHVPILKTLEAQLAVRHDEYSGGIGGTTNPKIALKFTPTKDLLFRASYSTGFRAPTPQQLHLATEMLQSTSSFTDPGCPTAGAASCTSEPMYATGGNPDLKPERSKQGSFGVVFSPLPGLSASADYWQINMRNRITTLNVTQEQQNYSIFENEFVRNPDGTLNYIQAGWVNSGASLSKGFDFNVTDSTALFGGRLTTILNATKVLTEREQILPYLPAVQELSQFDGNGALFLPWRATVSTSFANGPWATTLSAQYSSDYHDEDHTTWTTETAFQQRMVSSYTTFNLFTKYTGIKNLELSGGIINLFDRQPPFTWHDVDNSIGAGWDPRVADARGRTLQVGAKYTFF